MGPLDIVLVVLLAAVIVFALRHTLKKKKQGGCRCGCAGCDGCEKAGISRPEEERISKG